MQKRGLEITKPSFHIGYNPPLELDVKKHWVPVRILVLTIHSVCCSFANHIKELKTLCSGMRVKSNTRKSYSEVRPCQILLRSFINFRHLYGAERKWINPYKEAVSLRMS
jgi:hypothetical protein